MSEAPRSDFLEQMAISSRRRVEAAKRLCPESVLLEKARQVPPAPSLVRNPAGFDLIAELKLRSPAVGQLQASTEDVAARVSAYARAGAAAVSVLTEPSRFDGSMRHLELAARTLAPLSVPALRKDFLVDPYQLIEARLAGAGGALVILRMLSVAELRAMLDCARQLRLFVLLEAFDESDLEKLQELIASVEPAANTAAPVLAGLNCRDLTTLQIVPERLIQLVDRLPKSVPRVAESGVTTPADAARVAAAGYDLALVGSALMQGSDPQGLASELLTAGRARRVP